MRASTITLSLPALDRHIMALRALLKLRENTKAACLMQCSADQFDIHLENFTNGASQVDALKQWLYVRSTRIKTGNGLG